MAREVIDQINQRLMLSIFANAMVVTNCYQTNFTESQSGSNQVIRAFSCLLHNQVEAL